MLVVLGLGHFTVNAWAQVPAQGKPLTTAVVSGRSPFNPVQNPNLAEVHKLFWEQMKQIHEEIKTGKLTSLQAQERRKEFFSVMNQALQIYGKNGRKDLTDDQKNQLEQMLF